MLTSPIKRKIRQFQKVVPKGRCQQMQIIFHSIFLGVGSIISRWRGSEPALRIKERIRETEEIELPWVPEVFLACGGNFRCWPKPDTSSAVGRSYKDLTETGNRARKVSGTQGKIEPTYGGKFLLNIGRLWKCRPSVTTNIYK